MLNIAIVHLSILTNLPAVYIYFLAFRVFACVTLQLPAHDRGPVNGNIVARPRPEQMWRAER